MCSTLFISWATFFQSRKSKYAFILCSSIAILLPAILGGLRDLSIGVDTRFYLVSHFDAAKISENFLAFEVRLAALPSGAAGEILYGLIVYLSAKIFSDIHWLLFILQFLTFLCIYIGAYKHRHIVPLKLVWIIYFCLFYNDTYSIVRQHLAIAFIFAFIDYLEREEYKKFLFYMCIASFIHTSAYFSLLQILLFYFLKRMQYVNISIKKLFVIVGLIVCCLFFKQVLVFMSMFLSSLQKYTFYFTWIDHGTGNLRTAFYTLEILFLLLYSKKLKRIFPNFSFYEMNAFSALFLLQLGRILSAFVRIPYYCEIINIYLLAKLPFALPTPEGKKSAMLMLLLASLISWWYLYIYGNVNSTYPYIFGL